MIEEISMKNTNQSLKKGNENEIWCPWGFLFDCTETPNELGFPYWAVSFQGKQIIYDEKGELQENDSTFFQSGTMQY
ncbi:hypothetical protein Gotri_028225 [Gossypium trilobum]|uniref:Uncharacterized protein n=1 Tax=Gossypium trilobum TaxID=34281 RepID=A0A7J9FL28_9ROSI|nr:hypothetical protein [Gossypium trilobum]